MNKFWMVWNPNGHTPTYKHSTPENAQREATRICQQTGEDVFVLECIGAMTPAKPPVEWQDATLPSCNDTIMLTEAELPF